MRNGKRHIQIAKSICMPTNEPVHWIHHSPHHTNILGVRVLEHAALSQSLTIRRANPYEIGLTPVIRSKLQITSDSTHPSHVDCNHMLGLARLQYNFPNPLWSSLPLLKGMAYLNCVACICGSVANSAIIQIFRVQCTSTRKFSHMESCKNVTLETCSWHRII